MNIPLVGVGRLKESDLVKVLLPRGPCPATMSTPFHCFSAGNLIMKIFYHWTLENENRHYCIVKSIL